VAAGNVGIVETGRTVSRSVAESKIPPVTGSNPAGQAIK